MSASVALGLAFAHHRKDVNTKRQAAQALAGGLFRHFQDMSEAIATCISTVDIQDCWDERMSSDEITKAKAELDASLDRCIERLSIAAFDVCEKYCADLLPLDCDVSLRLRASCVSASLTRQRFESLKLNKSFARHGVRPRFLMLRHTHGELTFALAHITDVIEACRVYGTLDVNFDRIRGFLQQPPRRIY